MDTSKRTFDKNYNINKIPTEVDDNSSIFYNALRKSKEITKGFYFNKYRKNL